MAGKRPAAIKVEGFRELSRDLKKASKEIAKELRVELKEVGEIVSADARRRLSETDRKAAAGVRTRVRQTNVSSEQNNRKVTGKRPDFGRFQQRRFDKALASNRDKVIPAFDQALERVQRKTNL